MAAMSFAQSFGTAGPDGGAGTVSVALDVGQTGTRIVRSDGPTSVTTLADLTAVPISDPATAADVGQRLAAVVLSVMATARHALDTVAISLSGYLGPRERIAALAAPLMTVAQARTVVVAHDVLTAHLGALGQRAGVTLLAGTGAFAVARSTPGTWAVVDARGNLLGDHGSGYWIGRRGLMAAIDHGEGRLAAPALAHRAVGYAGPLESIAATAGAHTQRSAFIAGFAIHVAHAARAGDPTACAIFEAAGHELALTAIGAARQTFPGGQQVPLACTGSVFGSSDLLEPGLLPLLETSGFIWERTEPLGTPLDGAALLCHPQKLEDLPDMLLQSFSAGS